jgi:hypothetical protein
MALSAGQTYFAAFDTPAKGATFAGEKPAG